MSSRETSVLSAVEGGRPATLTGFLAELARQYGPREAVVFEDRRWSYADLARDAVRVAVGLRELGVRPGERVGIWLPNWPEFLSSLFAVTALGAVAVGINTLSTESELGYALGLVEVRSLIYTPTFLKHDYQAMLDRLEAAGQLGVLERRIAVTGEAATGRPGVIRFDSVGRTPNDPVTVLRELDPGDGDALAMMFFTSGSTARPKALLHAHRALLYQAFVASERFGLTQEDRALCYLPMFFTGGLALVALITLARGGTVVLQDHFEPGRALDLMERERTTFYAGWQFAPRLCTHPSFPGRKLHLRKGIFTDTPDAKKLLQPGHTTIAAYGMSETATLCCSGRWDDPIDLRHRGFGQPLPGVEVRVIDPDTGEVLRPGKVGEIIVKHPAAMLGYLGVPRDETFDRDGFFHTGDYGRLDESGSLFFDGRLKEVIKTAGVNVAAAEVEACLTKLDGVAAAYVVPVPHVERGENIAAFVVPRVGQGVDVPGLMSACRRELASYKVPRHLFVLAADQVPRTGTEKIDKPRLKRVAGELAGSSRDLLSGSESPR